MLRSDDDRSRERDRVASPEDVMSQLADQPTSGSVKAADGGCCGGAGKLVLTREQIAALPRHELIQYHRKGVEAFDKRVFWCTPTQLDSAFLADAGVGTWPIRVLLGHLADAEMVFIHRMRRAVAEECPVVAMWDENAFVDANMYGLPAVGEASEYPDRGPHPVAGFIAVIHMLRQWGTDWLMTLDEGALSRRLMHPERGAMTVRDVVSYNAWHLEHHAAFMRKKLDRLGVSAPGAKAAAASGSCGSGCGCSTPAK
jgi:uncharacterized damage-inducible protein DinB